ncbi:Zinc finger, GATA-type [Dillenia turbinata]|uniref:Zinc finger, GATA-type n=1 Tax=Dillenia turbinata TaxID=194707 RepID=A0AAN8UVL8_9MAGN
MHHRCSSGSQGNMVGPCSCGVFHSQTSCSSLSMFFSIPNNHHTASTVDEYSTEMYPFTSSSVDCTLSLGTPSTRLTSEEEHKRHRSGSCMSSFYWDIFQAKQQNPTSTAPAFHKTTRSSNTSSSITTTDSVNDSLLARRCANCDTTSTPLWRNGPRGPKSLCNACGIRFKKEERRASAGAATATGNNNATAGVMDHQNMMSSGQINSWVHNSQTSQKIPCYGNEYRFMDDDDRNQDNGISFLSWRLNVTDRPSLVHDFTR